MSSPRPTLFLSYASEDRAAVLKLREALEAAGLDVWYDANELGGGDAWDQKIRRQIRECDYFMPIVSATTERRKEGYFRREWRLAAERTMDMADDVMFLLPAVLDDTSEQGARVPEKFLTVQWLRVPGGDTTPQLEALAKRLATGDHSHPPRPTEKPPLLNRPRVDKTEPPFANEPEGPPPMPPFPHLGENHNFGHRMKFFAEILWWVLTVGWMLFKRAPRWLRVIIVIWFVMWGFSAAQCSRSDPPSRPPKSTAAEKPKPPATSDPDSAANAAAAHKALNEVADKLSQPGKDGEKAGEWGKIGARLARELAAEIKEQGNQDKRIVVLPFETGVADAPRAKYLRQVFMRLFSKLSVAHPGETGLMMRAPPEITAKNLAAVGQRLNAEYVLGARVANENGAAMFELTLVKVSDESVAWTGKYPAGGGDPAALADQIATGVLAVVPPP